MKSLKEIADKDSLIQIVQQRKNETGEVGEGSIMGDKSPASNACPLCLDRGIIFDGETARPCSCMNQKRIENRFRNARMAQNLVECRFESFSLDFYNSAGSPNHKDNALKALNAAKEFVARCCREAHGLGLLFTGKVGTGKTFLAAAVANALMEKELQVLFLVVPDLLDELRATYDKKAETTELDLLDTARGIPILILDDLGAHNYTEWTRNRLYSIVNYRLNQQLPTVITSNLNLQEMEEYLGERTTSRLLQMTRVFRLSSELDIRLRKYQEREGKR